MAKKNMANTSDEIISSDDLPDNACRTNFKKWPSPKYP
jgi:hypothetical protein